MGRMRIDSATNITQECRKAFQCVERGADTNGLTIWAA